MHSHMDIHGLLIKKSVVCVWPKWAHVFTRAASKLLTENLVASSSKWRAGGESWDQLFTATSADVVQLKSWSTHESKVFCSTWTKNILNTLGQHRTHRILYKNHQEPAHHLWSCAETTISSAQDSLHTSNDRLAFLSLIQVACPFCYRVEMRKREASVQSPDTYRMQRCNPKSYFSTDRHTVVESSVD
jgi:hemolysin-activating ACP:hemolysin acyltransferase